MRTPCGRNTAAPLEWGPAKWILRGHPGPKARRTVPEMFLVILVIANCFCMPQRSGHCKNQFNSQTSLNVFVKVCCLFASATYLPSFGEVCCLFAPARYIPSFGDSGADLIAHCELHVGEHNFILWITRLHSWWARKVSGDPRRGSWGGGRGVFGSFLGSHFFLFCTVFGHQNRSFEW